MDAANVTGTLRRNITAVLTEIAQACKRAGRALDEVTILPITKYVDAELVAHLASAGLRTVGESTVQETLRKREILGVAAAGVRWHLIGHLQRNKVGKALELFDAIHSLDSVRLAKAIDARLSIMEAPAIEPESAIEPEELDLTDDDDATEAPAPRPALFVEVNIAREPSKTGVAPDELLDLLGAIHEETGLASRLRGLMAMAPHSSDPGAARPYFENLRHLRDTAISCALLPASAELSMGMSGDFVVAVEEGASIVRIGSRLFEGLPQRRR